MDFSLALIILLGLLANKLFEKLKLPGLIGMLLVGILVGPYGLNILSNELLSLSSDFTKIALIVILFRAGIGLNKNKLKKVAKPAILLSFIPSLLEGISIAVVSIYLFDFTIIEGGMLGFIIAAVSSAVVIPAMLDYDKQGVGSKKGITTLILAGASMDNVFAITIFSSIIGIYGTKKISVLFAISQVFISVILGVLIGVIVGFLLIYLFKKWDIRDTKKTLILIGLAIFITSFETLLKGIVPLSSLLGIMTIGFIILEKLPKVAKGLSSKFNKVWIFAEILLFVLVGAKVNINEIFTSGLKGLLIIIVGLIFRSIGVLISTHNSGLNKKERMFCVISFIPKATVQAAIGAIPLIMGVPTGELILAVAVLAIIITAPIGAIGIKHGAKKLLT